MSAVANPSPTASASLATPSTIAAHDALSPAFDPFADAVESVIATTDPQREVWLGAQLSPEASLAYNETVVLRLRGLLDVAALQRALSRLRARHQSLRASISPDGMHMFVAPPAPFDLPVHDMAALDAESRTQALAAIRAAAVHTPFDLEHGPLFKGALCRCADADHELVLSAHHAVCDGWSWAVITEELSLLYSQVPGTEPALRPAPFFAAFASLEAAATAHPDMASHHAYWLAQFPGTEQPTLELPVDFARPAVRTFSSRRIERRLDPTLVSGMRELTARSGTSLFVGLFSTFAALLHRLTGQEDLVIGIPIAGQLCHDMPGLVGHCVNLLPLRVSAPSKLTFDALMRRASNAVMDAFEHQAVTYGALLGKLALQRDPSRLPLVSVMFNLDAENTRHARGFPGLDVQQSTLARAYENFEIFLNIVPQAGGLQLELQYNADLFDAQSASRWLDIYESLLRSISLHPTESIGKLGVLSSDAEAALVALQPPRTHWAGHSLMHAGFVAQSNAQPDRIALRHGVQRCSYAALDAQSNQLAHALRARGVGRGQRVGLCLERGIDMVVGLIAILKAGAAYVPLDPGFPRARLEHYAEDAHLSLLLTASSVAAAPRHWCDDAATRIFDLDLEQGWRTGPAGALTASSLDARPEDAAYVIYTSGSTGRPKGVCIAHRSVVNLIESMRQAPGIDATDTLAAVTTLSFDIAVAELMLPLAAGAQVVLIDRETAMDGNRLAQLMAAEQVTVLQATPGTWRLLIDAQWSGAPGFRAWVGGESVQPSLAYELLDRTAQAWNVYGPTETTVWSTAWHIRRDVVASRGIAIGQPLANTAVWILDAEFQVCPIGVPGEICIAGDGVALGYLERPELTAERFIDVSLKGSNTPIYRTGDRGRWRNDGQLEHLGRYDFQLKVRGYRIEPGEIEARCSEAPGVARCVVIAREDLPGDVRLVAYLALSGDGEFDLDALMRHLRDRLPAYMVPAHIVSLPQLPELPNGKIDRKALPAPIAMVATRTTAERLAPRTATERAVLQAMERVLSLPSMDIRDDFFNLGGHSLLAARLATLLGREFGITLPLRTLFEAPTGERLAGAVDLILGHGEATRITIPHRPDRRSSPLTPSQERLSFVERMHPGRSVYNAPSAHRLLGVLDTVAMEEALNEIARRQPALRTSLGLDEATGRPAMRTVAAVRIQLSLIDLQTLPEDQREAELMERTQELADRPIDLSLAPLCHATLFRLSTLEHVFLFVPHHMIWDGWSFDLFQHELSQIYSALLAGVPHGLPALEINHGDYAEWLGGWMDQPAYQEQLRHWKLRFANTPVPRAPATDMPRRNGMSGQGGTQWVHVDPVTAEPLRDAARTMGVTLNMLCFGVFCLMVSQAIDSPTVVIATPVRGRQIHETEDVIGFFNNVLPVAIDVDPTLSLGDFMKYVRHELMSLMDHQEVPFERLVTEPEFTARMKGVGLYQAMFSFQDARARPTGLGPLRISQIHVHQRGATDDLGVWLMDTAHGIDGALVYNADIYLRETGARLRDRYLELLHKVVLDPLASIAQLSSRDGSASAAYLTRLSSNLTERTPPADAVAEAAGSSLATSQALMSPEHAELAQVWAGVLGIDVNEIRASDNFFDLGGDSLLAMRTVQQTELTLGYRVEPRRYLFENLGQLARLPSLPLVRFTAGTADGGGGASQPMPQPRGGLIARMFGRRGQKG